MSDAEIKCIYCLSGLGADHRIFSHLELPGIRLVHLDWLLPQAKTETLDEYAKRLSAFIDEEEPLMMGVSFGGMMSIEIAKHRKVRGIILISSVKSYHELPAWMKFLGKCHAEYLIPKTPLKSIGPLKSLRPIQNYFLGAHAPAEIAIANEFRDNVDPHYLKWSIRQIFNWKNDWCPPTLYHVHGDNDKLFPITNVHPTHIVPGGGHFMVMSHCREVSRILQEICNEQCAQSQKREAV